MTDNKLLQSILSDNDLDFLIETAAPEVTDRSRLKQIILHDRDFRNAFLAEERLFKHLLRDDVALVKLSPSVYFEILLRHTVKELSEHCYTFEKSGHGGYIPVFDNDALVDLLNDEDVLLYLAHMLATFTRMESFTLEIHIGQGTWHKIRFNDMDIEALRRFAGLVDEEYRFGLYKRIGDVCLFILGLFPDYAENEYRYPFSRQLRPLPAGRSRMAPAEYNEEGRRFYRLAAEHHSAAELKLESVFWKLHSGFQKASKPLTFIADHYLDQRKGLLFG